MPGYRGTPKERLLRRVEMDPDTGCWMWQGAQSGSGYGQIKIRRGESPKLVHRLAYELFVGPIPLDEKGKSLFIDHLCYDKDGYSNKMCCNPDHLEPVTDLINKRRGMVPKRAAGWVHYKKKKKAEEGGVQ